MPSMVPHTSSTSGMLSDLIVNRFQYAITSGREMYRMVNEKMRMSKSTISTGCDMGQSSWRIVRRPSNNGY